MHKNKFFPFFLFTAYSSRSLRASTTIDGEIKSLFLCVKALQSLGGEDYMKFTCTVDAIRREAVEKAKISFDLYLNCDVNGDKHPRKF